MASNTLYAVQGHDHPWLQATALVVRDASWVAGHAPDTKALAAKTRYRQTESPCEFTGEAEVNVPSPDFTLRFTAPQWAATPGQSAVLYDGDVCLGGGVIESASA